VEYTEWRLTGSAAQVLENLPPPLAKLLMDELYRTQVKSVPMFNGMQEEVVIRICYALRPLNCMEGDFIFKEGELGQEMYIMEKGAVVLSRYNITLATLGPGSFFGEGALQNKRYHRNRTAQAIQDCDLAFLKKEDIHKIAGDYPQLMDRITELADKRLIGENELLNNVLDETAKSLGVEPHSEEMRKVIEATEALTKSEVTDPSLKQGMSEEHAVTMIQRHFRGRQERRKHVYRKRTRVVRPSHAMHSMLSFNIIPTTTYPVRPRLHLG
jgi:CRP-like cAMP-binding protein